jgi:hypothetical protein
MEISSIAFGITIIFNMIYMLYSFRRDDNDLHNILMYGYYDDNDDEEVVFEYSVVDDDNDIWFELL